MGIRVDDDPDDFLPAGEALRETGLPNDIQLAADGEEMKETFRIALTP